MQEVAAKRLTEYSHGAGCACKLSPVELSRVLGALPVVDDANVLVGTGNRDDAAVYRLDEDRALVATVDFFTPIVDDPTSFGRIAAANSVSDVYAMGGRPLFALSVLAFPREKLADGILERIVAGGAGKLAEAHVPVVGGHSIDDPEPKFGYAVVGEVDPRRMVTHEGATPGDALYLTKPLGTGIVTTAIKRGVCPPEVEASAVAVMTHLNGTASRAMVDVGVKCATDVTGYGLVAHLLNLGIDATVDFAAIPVLKGVRELAGAGIFPGGTERNLSAVEDLVDFGALSRTDKLLICDAQTSGGLLAAVRPDVAGRFEELLAGEPYRPVRIGTVEAGGGVRVVS